MSENTVGVIVLTAFLSLIGGLFAWTRWRKAQERKSWPTSWVSTGISPPDNLDIALSIIGRHTPGMVQAGTIEWVKDPFSVGWTMAAGTVMSVKPIHIKLMFFDKVESTALVHEIGHVWSELTNQGFGELYSGSDPRSDQRFAAWIKMVNDEIITALRT